MMFGNNKGKHRLELITEDGTAFIDYKYSEQTNRIYLIHTEVPKSLRNKGIGEKLVKRSLDYIKRNSWRLMPVCPFVVTYLKRHPEYHSILDPTKRAEFQQ